MMVPGLFYFLFGEKMSKKKAFEHIAELDVELGDKVVDTVSGFSGIAVGVAVFLNGCARIMVQPKVDKEGKYPDAVWFDEPQLQVTKKEKVPVADERKTGGPMPSIPTRMSGPRR
jgi:hypothetical protein